MRQRRRFLRVVANLLVNLVLLAVLAEGGARGVYPIVRGGGFTWADAVARLHAGVTIEDLARGDRTRAAGFAADAIPHPYLGWVSDPAAVIVQNGKAARPNTRFGFMGGDIVAKGSDDEIVIGLGGGSVAGGFWLQGQRELREALGADPLFMGKRLRIENFAVAGYKQPQALFTLMYLLVQGAHFDYWINLDGFNEIALPVTENLPAHVAAVFPRGWPALAARGGSGGEFAILAERFGAIRGRERLRERLAESILARSAFVVACWDAADRRYARRIAAFDAQYREVLAGADAGAAVQGPLYGQPAPDADAVLKESVEIWKNASREMARVCAANGIGYFQFLQPNQYVKDSKPFSEEERRTAIAQGGYQPAAEKGYPMLIEAAKELRAEGAPVTDLTQVFQGDARTIYEDTCCHVNALGNRIIAARVAEAILGSAGK